MGKIIFDHLSVSVVFEDFGGHHHIAPLNGLMSLHCLVLCGVIAMFESVFRERFCMAVSPDEFVDLFHKQKASAILRTSHREHAGAAMDAAVRGGFRIVEFTLTVPNVFDLIREFSDRDEGLIVGAGTVLSVEDANKAVEAGAQYLVSPVFDVDVVQEAKRLNVAVMPGCSTPSEMLAAYRAGAQLQKLFPAAGTGTAWVKQMLGPMPFLKIVPTSGVHLNNAASYLKAGAHAVGFVSSLFDTVSIGSGAFSRIEDTATKMLESIRKR